jgi:hypothetical protein
MKRLIAICVVLAIAVMASQATAMITVDPDAFAVGTDISNAFAGVTLSSVGAGFDGDYDSRIFAIDPMAWGEPFAASTGRLVFGTNDPAWPNLFGGFGSAVLRVDFSSPVTVVSIDAIGNNSSDWAKLEAFDASNNLIDDYFTGQLTLSNFETMTVSGSNIAYVLASPITGESAGFDNLNADISVVPAPGAMLLGGIGVSIVGWMRRRRVL